MTRGEKLYRLRSQSGLTLRQAAERIGISESTLWHYEQDDFFSPEPEILQKICRLYQTSAELLAEETQTGCSLSLTKEELFARYRCLSLRNKLRVLYIQFGQKTINGT